MRDRRQAGFRKLGDVAIDDRAGLPPRRARDLRLQRAWLRAAGQRLAATVRAVRVLRGTLEIAIEDDGRRRELGPVLPILAARVASEEPALAIRRFRVLTGAGSEASREIADGEAVRAFYETARRSRSDSGLPRSSGATADASIEAIAERYLRAR